MSFAATHAVLEQPRDLCDLRCHSSSFSDLTFPQHAPWLYSVLSELWGLEHRGRNVRGIGDLRVPAETSLRLRRLLSKVGRLTSSPTGTNLVPVPSLTAFAGGGISLSWELGNRELKYTIWPEGLLTSWQEEGGETISEDEAAVEAFDPTQSIEWLTRP